MNTTFAKFLTMGPLFRNSQGVIHISRTDDSDTECKLLNGNIKEFGLLSAIREVADIETSDSFVPSRDSYLSIAAHVESMAGLASEEFGGLYREVARLVAEHANTFVVEVVA
jgi:hypothetical protein